MKPWHINTIRTIFSLVFFVLCLYGLDYFLEVLDSEKHISIVGKPPGPFNILDYKDYIAIIGSLAGAMTVFSKIPIFIVKTALWLNKKRRTKRKMKHTEECLNGGECECAVNMSEQANAGMTRDDSSTSTRLLDKNWSPLIVRKYQMEGWPMYIGIICDANLNDLDEVVYKIMDEAKRNDFVNGTIQGIRNTCGLLSDRIVSHYNEIKRGVAEGVIVCWYVDKCFVSSAYGDFMTHEKCAMEFYQIVNTLPHI